MKKFLFCYLFLFSGFALAASAEDKRLIDLFDRIWEFQMLSDPTFATYVGYPGQNANWRDVSLEAVSKSDKKLRSFLEEIRDIDSSKLSESSAFDKMLVEKHLADQVAGIQFPEELILIYQLGGVQQDVAGTLEMMPKAKARDFEDRISRLSKVASVVDDTIAVLQVGLEKGVTPPAVTLRDVPQQIRNVMTDNVADSPLLASFSGFPESMPSGQQADLIARAKKIITAEINPAFRRLLKFMEQEYIPGSASSIAMKDLPGGEAWYRHRVRHYTTLEKDPKEIHELGLSEVKRIRAEMDRVISESGFKGSFAEFTEFLRTDPQFFTKTPEELLMRYRDIAKRADPELARLFGKLPRLPYGVIPIPDYAAKSQTTAYYWGGSNKDGRPGYFYANTYALETRPIWEMEALTLHEAMPGHHLQISLAQELPEAHPLLRNLFYTGFVEGWGLYSESLGEEMGFYQDPYSKFGQLTYEMWRAVRLVVDTGMHLFGWDRQKAIDFFAANTAKTLHDIEVEIDRYIAWPGQALAYKLGELTIKDLRAKAADKLGDEFNIREFHDQVHSRGAVPLDVLESRMNSWMNSKIK